MVEVNKKENINFTSVSGIQIPAWKFDMPSRPPLLLDKAGRQW